MGTHWVGEAALTVLSVLDEILLCALLGWRVFAVGFPAEERALLLRVDGHAGLHVGLGMLFVWVPTELVVLTLRV